MSELARKGKIDVRGDEEQNSKLLQIISLLIDGGYHRARIKGLSPFDKIVGGMAWCIETCSYDLDVDLLFHDSLSIGQKISLTERIVEVLPSMKCPYAIEPHQIQGLDSIHIYPVVKWLMDLAVEKRKKFKDEIRLISLDEFQREFGQHEDARTSTNYIFKVKQLFGHSTDWEGCRDFTADSSSSISRKNLRLPDSSNLSSRVIQMTNELECIKTQLLDKKQQKCDLKTELASVAVKLDEYSSSYKESALFNGQEEISEEFQTLLEENEACRDRMSKFKSSCLHEEAALKAKIESLQLKIREPKEQDPSILQKHEELSAKCGEYEAKLSACNRRVLILKKQLDNLPSQAEIAQYQKRFVELYYQVSLNHHETLQFNNLFNSISGTKTYMEKEVSLLNSIASNLGRSLDSPRNLLEFTQQLKEIMENLEGNKRKLQNNLLEENQCKNKITRELYDLRALENQYNILLNQFGKLVNG